MRNRDLHGPRIPHPSVYPPWRRFTGARHKFLNIKNRGCDEIAFKVSLPWIWPILLEQPYIVGKVFQPVGFRHGGSKSAEVVSVAAYIMLCHGPRQHQRTSQRTCIVHQRASTMQFTGGLHVIIDYFSATDIPA